jgi:hypothetical protein
VGGESLIGVSRAGRAMIQAVGERYADGESLARALAAAQGAGADGVLVSPCARVREALARGGSPPVWALLPNVPEYVRDSSDAGLVGAALRRVRRAGPLTLARLGLTGLAHAPAILASDFAGLVPLLLELEMAALGARRVEGVILAAPITDLALAGRHRRFFASVAAFMRRRFGGAGGFETHNLGHLLRALREWDLAPDLVVGPVNPRGLLMKPSAGELLAELRRARVPVVAKELTAGGAVPLEAGARFAREHGAAGNVADLGELGEPSELAERVRALAG